MKKLLFAITIICILGGCMSESKNELKASSILKMVDQAHMTIEKNTIKYREIVQLDHHRMAEHDGGETPPAIVSIFKDYSKIIPHLMQKNQLIGLDMPFKILAYSEPDAEKPSYAYTSAEFIQKRHGLKKTDMVRYKKVIDAIVAELPQDLISKSDLTTVKKDFGMIKIKSDFNYEETVTNIRAMAHDQENTLWFAEMDLQKDAMQEGVEIRPTMLFLYGVPKTGATAMKTAPKIGLDAFCQKVLIYEKADSSVHVACNNAIKFGALYYGESNPGQLVVAVSMKKSLTTAVTKEETEN